MSFIKVGFILNCQKIYIPAKEDELFAEVVVRFMQRINLNMNNSLKFFFNGKELKLEAPKTLGENYIHNEGIIDVIAMNYSSPSITIYMKKENEKIPIHAFSDNVLSDVIKKYIVANFHEEKKLHYFFNSKELKDFTKTLAQYNIADKSIIEVKECNYELCSKYYNYISLIQKEKNELKKRLNEEMNKNSKLSIENEKLRKKLENANIKIESLEKLKKKQIGLNNDDNQSEYLITSLNPGDKLLAVNFVSMGNQDIGHYNLICKNTDLFINLEERLYKDFPKFKDYNTFFSVNGKGVKRFKSIGDNNIKNNDVISIFINDD